MDNGELALYLYCFARSDAVRVVKAAAVDGPIPVAIVVQSGDLCAVLSEVAQQDFCGPGAELHMQQLAWVAPRSVQHEAVIEEVMATSPVLPLPFGTLFSSSEALAKFVDQHRETINLFLGRVANHEEWSVKGWFDRRQAQRALTSARLKEQQERLSAMLAGTRHLTEQRICRAIERELNAWLNQTSRTIASELASQASDFRECEVPSGAQAESGLDEVLNWAFLLPESAVAQFHNRVVRANQDYRSQGLLLQLSGPWPPYRFVPALSSARNS